MECVAPPIFFIVATLVTDVLSYSSWFVLLCNNLWILQFQTIIGITGACDTFNMVCVGSPDNIIIFKKVNELV